MTLLLNLVVLIAFTFVARGFLGARNVTWVRLIFAALLAWVIGVLLAVLIVYGEGGLTRQELQETGTATVFLVTALFEIPITMAIVVALELMSSRARKPRRLRPVNPWKALTRRLSIARRGSEVARVAARHGFGAFRKRRVNVDDPAAQAREVTAAIEELGGVYTKLGQLLATRPDLLPPDAVAEFSKLQSAATPLPFDVVEEVIRAEVGDPAEVFATIDRAPLGSASIAQVHAAVLRDGGDVVVKVQRPGLEDDVERDLAILDWFTRNLEKRSDVARTYRAQQIVDEFAASMQRELDFRNEAAQVVSIAAALEGYPQIHLPAVVADLTTERVLVMERLQGQPLVTLPRDADIPDRERLADALCESQLRAMLNGQRFHGDPHPGNVLLLEDGRLGLIDFGMTGRLDSFGRAFVVEMLAGLHLEEPSLIYEALISGGSIDTSADRDRIERAVASFMSSHSASEMLSGNAITELMAVAANLGAAFPRDAAVMLRAVATLSGTLNVLVPDYPLIERFADIAGAEMQRRTQPSSLKDLAQREVATLAPFVKRLPRHIDRIASQIERGELRTQVSFFSNTHDVAILERLLNRALLSIIGLGILGLSVLLVRTEVGPSVGVSDFYLTQLLGWVGLFAGTALVLRALLDVLRPPSGAPPV